MKNSKDLITNIVALVSVVGGAANAYLQSAAGDINWGQLGGACLLAVVAWFTGKKTNN